MDVTRTWKRDRSENVMPIGTACANLKHNGVCTQEEAYSRLIAGDTLCTRHAEFKLTDGGDTYYPPSQQSAGLVNPNEADLPFIIPSTTELLGG